MARRKRSLAGRLHDYFLPHKGNGYKPHVFRTASVASLVLAIVILEGAYLTQVDFVFPKTNFLASVLPGTLIALTNTDRAAANAPAVVENPLLDQAATLAAEDMATKGYFAHVSPTGVTPWDWLAQVGYNYSYAGENLAVNFTDSSAVENAWLASPTHYANIVKQQYTQMGVGVANGAYEGQTTTFVVTFFATPAVASTPAPPPTPTSESTPSVALAKPAPAPTTSAPAPTTATPAATTSAQPARVSAPVPTTPTVLGVQVTPPKPSWFDRVAASPTHIIVLILSILAGLVAILFAIAVFVKARVQYLEVIAGGFILLALLIGLIVFNTLTTAQVIVPVTTQDSSVVS
jgi:hypothetical protein